LNLTEEDAMANSDQNTSHEAENGEEKVDERLSKLSLIARNVTLRLSTTTKRGTISRKVAGKTKESLVNSKNAKTLHKIGGADLRSTNVDPIKPTEESEPTEIENDCSESSSAKTETNNWGTSFLIKQLSTTEEMGEQNEQCKNEVVKDKVECSDCEKQAEPSAHNCNKRLLNSETNNTRTSPLTELLTAERKSPRKSNETQKCNSPKQTSPAKNLDQTSTVKPRLPFATIRRRKSMKLGERSLVRKKSFLKKGDGLSARKQLTRQAKTRSTGAEITMEKTRDKMFLRMPGKKDKTNSTFLLTRQRKLPNKDTACESSETTKSSFRTRRQWSENGVQVISI
jgi:hypothetical protein